MSDRHDLEVVRTTADLRRQVALWRGTGQTISLVPTMGGLHEGHLSLVRAGRDGTDRVVVTVFVNPAQFGPGEDLDTYPRDAERDRALLAGESADLLFMPDVAHMYPPGDCTRIHMGAMGACLEGRFRPDFFTGVATVVAKLLIQSLPDRALFGEKDFQQLQVIRRMVRDLHLPVQVTGLPTVREKDGLALSSRNVYLNTEERKIAPRLYRVITEVAQTAAEGGDVPAAIDRGRAVLLSAGFSSVDYLACCDSETLEDISCRDISYRDNADRQKDRVLAAATLGRTRLIDNVAVS